MIEHKAHNPLTDVSNTNTFSWEISRNVKLKKYYFKNDSECFITISEHEKTDERTKPLRPSSFIVFECLEIVMKRDARCLKWFLQRNNTKLCSVAFFPFFFKMPWRMYVWFVVIIRHSLDLWPFLFNYPIVSHCTKFVLQKRFEFEVIYILSVLPWPKEGFASQKHSRKKNFAQREQYRSPPNTWAVGIFEDWQLLHMELVSSENHHKPHNIKPRLNNYSIWKKKKSRHLYSALSQHFVGDFARLFI